MDRNVFVKKIDYDNVIMQITIEIGREYRPGAIIGCNVKRRIKCPVTPIH
jgi:hypothetical protein